MSKHVKVFAALVLLAGAIAITPGTAFAQHPMAADTTVVAGTAVVGEARRGDAVGVAAAGARLVAEDPASAIPAACYPRRIITAGRTTTTGLAAGCACASCAAAIGSCAAPGAAGDRAEHARLAGINLFRGAQTRDT